jgi:hypothetical protein
MSLSFGVFACEVYLTAIPFALMIAIKCRLNHECYCIVVFVTFYLVTFCVLVCMCLCFISYNLVNVNIVLVGLASLL